MSYKVFVSSSMKDIDLAQDLAQRLKSAGIKVNAVDKAAASGEVFSTKIKRELRDADEIFVILTEESIDNSNLMFEIGAASSLRKRITPIVVGLEPSQLPSLIRNLTYVKYSNIGKYLEDLERQAKAA